MDEQKPEPRTRKRWSIPPGTRRPTLGRSPELQEWLDKVGAKEVKGRPNEGQALIFENPKRKVWPKKPGAPPPEQPEKAPAASEKGSPPESEE